jgi:hypothetical protein
MFEHDEGEHIDDDEDNDDDDDDDDDDECPMTPPACEEEAPLGDEMP